MSRFSAQLLLFISVLALACSREEGRQGTEIPPLTAPPSAELGADFAPASGIYEVAGLTVEATSGQQRAIEGTIELDVKGAQYEVRFEFATTAPDFEEPVPVRIRGSGNGLIVGKLFTGTTEEWMSLAAPPDALGALDEVKLPAQVGWRMHSASQASFDADGALHVLLQNYPAPGQHYRPTMTVLAGRRAAKEHAGLPPPRKLE